MKEAVGLRNKNDWQGALEKFQEVLKLADSQNAKGNLAKVLVHLGRFVEALDTYRALQRDYGAKLSDAQAGELQEKIDLLENSKTNRRTGYDIFFFDDCY